MVKSRSLCVEHFEQFVEHSLMPALPDGITIQSKPNYPAFWNEWSTIHNFGKVVTPYLLESRTDHEVTSGHLQISVPESEIDSLVNEMIENSGGTDGFEQPIVVACLRRG